MKQGIHPQWFDDATVICACGNTWKTGATKKELRVDVCSACHPFFTGQQRIVDTEGQVDRFYKRLQVRSTMMADAEAREAQRTSPDLPITELGLGTRYANVLLENGVTVVGDVLTKFETGGEDAVLSIQGFGRKALAELKKKLRERGYKLPDNVEVYEAE